MITGLGAHALLPGPRTPASAPDAQRIGIALLTRYMEIT